MDKYLCYILMILSVIVASFSQVLLKKSAKKKYSNVIREYLNALVIIGYGMMMLTTVLTLFSYKTGLEYKSGPVIESIGYLLIMVLSYLFFKEKITAKKLIGNAIIVLGIVVFYI